MLTRQQHTDLGDLASGLRGTLDAMEQLSHDRETRDQLTAGALFMSRALYDLVHSLDGPPLEDSSE